MKNSRFFCENCGAQVSRDAKSCPHCGKSFVSVRCSACGFTGEEALFRTGCPVCGYSPASGPGKGKSPGIPFPREEATGSLPVWVYVLTGAALVAVGIVFFFTLR
ncbi:MAG: zinc ribbon domain-containing protein [Treponema sp.]|jgi:RNA polymerase subunit RPABC4/transcription elongation factor Spt4|nr:zinc ribbon domain-containing protein [Treponema sp.]